MPKRNRDRLIQGSILQGADSFVRVKAVSIEEALDMQLPPPEKPVRKNTDGLSDDELAQYEAEYEAECERVDSEYATASEQHSRATLCKYVLDWNWVDDNDQPLDKPFGNAEVFKKLTGAEIKYLALAVSGSDDLRAQKKRR